MSISSKKIIVSLILIAILSIVMLTLGVQFAFAQAEPTSCGTLCSILKFFQNPWDSLAGGFGNLLISLTSTFLYISGSLFDLLIKFTIVEFGGQLKNIGLIDSITSVWEAFRDIGNIVIIGMFVFVAISTILGIDEYGAKKMISRLLIVAVLINFSLFFTKVIIDASHITAKQFYSSIVQVAATSEFGSGRDLISSNPSDSALRDVGISGAFMQKSGIVGGFDTFKFRERIEKNNGSPFTTIIVYSVLVSLLLFTVSILFLYGSFLLASRGILLVVLMITSSLAFASYLIPTFSKSQYGWSGWWSSLLKSAAMAPLLMIFLWATLFILQQPNGSGEGGPTIAAFLENPGDSTAWEVAWLLIITIGLLFASIKMSQSLSSGITGFKMSARLPGFAALAASRITGYAGRGIVGGGSNLALEGMKAFNKARGRRGKETAIERGLMRRLDNLQNFTYDPLSSKKARSFFKDTSGIEAKKDVGKGGYVGDLGRAAEKGVKQAKVTAVSEEEGKEIYQNALNEAKAAAQQNPDYQSSVARQDGSDKEQQIARSEKNQVNKDLQKSIEKLTEAQNRGETSLQDYHDEINQKRGELGQVETRIVNAQESIEREQQIQRGHVEDIAEAASEPASIEGQAKRAAYRRPGTLWGAARVFRGRYNPNDPAAKKVKNTIKSQKSKKRLKETFGDDIKDIASESASTSSSGSTPPPSGGTTST